MKHGLVIAGLSLGLMAGTTASNATTYDYTNSGAGNTVAISQTTGDAADADFTYSTVTGSFGQSALFFSNIARMWTPAEYSGDQAIYSDGNGRKLQVQADAGAGLKFTSFTFDLGAYPNVNQPQSYSIFDSLWNLVDTNSITVLGTNAGALITVALNTSSVVFQMGNNWNVGLRSVTYTTAPVSAVPLPGAFVLLGSGLAGLVALRRRRKTRS